MQVDELLTYLFDGRSHRLAEPMRTWLASSRRFTAFVSQFRDKIRKKLRVTQDPKTLQDLKLELETAYLLLQEKSLSVAYEPEQSGPGRSPDFAVTFTTSLTFMLEVTRLHGFPDERLADAICSKLGQLQAQRSNVLLVGVDGPRVPEGDLDAMMLRLQQRAEAADSTLRQRYRFRDRADFFRHYQRLSEVIVRGGQGQGDAWFAAWVNPQAKYPLPSKVRTSLYRSQEVG